jgi:hypothetical protein
MKTLVVALILALAARAGAVEVALSVSPCAGEAAQQEQLVELLRIELASTLAQPVALRLDAASANGDASYRLRLDCTDTRDVLDLQIARRAPPGAYREQVSLVQLPERMRPRTVALAISEDVRWLDQSKDEEPPARAVEPAPELVVAPPAPPPPVAAPLVTAPPLRPTRDARTLRLTRNLTLGLGLSSLGLLAIGIPLNSAGSGPDHNDPGMVGSGAAFTTLGVLSAAGATVSFVFWLRERRRPAP